MSVNATDTLVPDEQVAKFTLDAEQPAFPVLISAFHNMKFSVCK